MYSRKLFDVGQGTHHEWALRKMLTNYLAGWIADNLAPAKRPINETSDQRLERSFQLVSEHFALGKEMFPGEMKDPFFTYQDYKNDDLSNRLNTGAYQEFQRHVNACLRFFTEADLRHNQKITYEDATRDMGASGLDKLSKLKATLKEQGLSQAATQDAIIGYALRSACVGGFSYGVPTLLSSQWTGLMRDYTNSLLNSGHPTWLSSRLEEEQKEPRVYELYRHTPPLSIYKLPATHIAGNPPREYPMKDLGEAVLYINNNTFGGKRPETAGRDDPIIGEIVPAPNGLHVFDRLVSEGQVLSCMESLKKLFRIVEDGPMKGERVQGNVKKEDPRFQWRDFLGPHRSNNNILFIAKGMKQPKYHECMRHIRLYDEKLYSFIAKHAAFYKRLMGASDEDINNCQLQLVHYFKGKGLNAHIDSVSAYGNTLGPIFTINMNVNEKGFDLYPTLKMAGTPVLRLFTTKGETTMMDGESRILWSHGVPTGSKTENYTIAFKFPCLSRYRDDASGGQVNIVIEDKYGDIPQSLISVDIPQNLAEEYRTPLHDVYQQVPVPPDIPMYVPPPPPPEQDPDEAPEPVAPRPPVAPAWGRKHW